MLTYDELKEALTYCKGCHAQINEEIFRYIDNQNEKIDRQKAEIERLNSCVKSEDEIRAIMKDQMSSMVREIVNEQIDTAIKLARTEFAEKVKNSRSRLFNTIYSDLFFGEKIDELLEEMEINK